MQISSLSLVLPCFNEEGNIRQTVENTAAWFREAGIAGEIVAVDDGSSDQTAEILTSLCASVPFLRIVRHERNQGYARALQSGLDAATGEIMGFMDSDGQFKAKDLEKLLPLLADVPFVTGRRLHRADPLRRIIIAKVSAMLVYLILGVWVRDINCGMKLWRRDIWRDIRPRQVTGALFNAELFFRIKRHGIPWKQIPVPHYPRLHGTQTGGSPLVLLRALKELWKLRSNRRKAPRTKSHAPNNQ